MIVLCVSVWNIYVFFFFCLKRKTYTKQCSVIGFLKAIKKKQNEKSFEQLWKNYNNQTEEIFVNIHDEDDREEKQSLALLFSPLDFGSNYHIIVKLGKGKWCLKNDFMFLLSGFYEPLATEQSRLFRIKMWFSFRINEFNLSNIIMMKWGQLSFYL